MSRYIPRPLADLRAELASLLIAKRNGSLKQPLGSLLGPILERYLESDACALTSVREKGIARLPEREQVIVRSALDKTLELLRGVDPQRSSARQLDRLIQDVEVRVGERIYAMWMAGEPEEVVEPVSAILTEAVEDFHLRGVLHRCMRVNNLDATSIAPAVFAALVAHENEDRGLTASEALRKFELAEKSKTPARTLRAVGEVLHGAIRQKHLEIGRIVDIYSQTAQAVFHPTSNDPAKSKRAPAHMLAAPIEEQRGAPLLRMGTLIAFAASARGGGDEARIEGALEIYRSLVTVAQRRAAAQGADTTRYALLNSMTSHLRRLSQIVRAEQRAHREVDGRWKGIEKELEKEAKFLQRGWKDEDGPMPLPEYPFPDDFSALECRALYLQNAVLRGIPLGLVLQELYDSDKLTFGPTERQFFERVAFYAARKFSSDLAVQSDIRVEGVATRRTRVEDVRSIARHIEVALREREYLSDDELIAMGDDMLDKALSEGDLNREEAQILIGHSAPLISPVHGEILPTGSISTHMVARIRARQEVRLLTAILAIEEKMPRDVIRDYRDLPHTRYHAMQGLAEFNVRNLIARNGQALSDLETSTRARWMRYRLQEASHQDVTTLDVEEVEVPGSTSNTYHQDVKRKPFGQRELPEVARPSARKAAPQPIMRRR